MLTSNSTASVGILDFFSFQRGLIELGINSISVNKTFWLCESCLKYLKPSTASLMVKNVLIRLVQMHSATQ